AHSSVEKAARLLGLAVQKVPVDSEFRMRTNDLHELSGACALVATVGTTSSTSVDPVAELAEICEREDVWLHVDAAYAGSAIVCPEFRWAWEGIERADSVVVNPHFFFSSRRRHTSSAPRPVPGRVSTSNLCTSRSRSSSMRRCSSPSPLTTVS